VAATTSTRRHLPGTIAVTTRDPPARCRKRRRGNEPRSFIPRVLPRPVGARPLPLADHARRARSHRGVAAGPRPPHRLRQDRLPRRRALRPRGPGHRPLAERTAPRRIWFVVDRRIVVDEAFERARRGAEKLAAAKAGPLKEVADRLRALSGTERPLAVARLRGGIFKDDGWARIPSQPAIITSTVDQLGSRLLFRGYGHSLLAAPIFAGLAANDSLIILDEAHCAVPFLETLRAIQRYRGPDWAEAPIPAPFAFVVMSATPPRELAPSEVFPGRHRKQALDHPLLQRRLHSPKLAELLEVKRTAN